MSRIASLQKITVALALTLGLSYTAHAEEDLVHAVRGVVKHVDHTAKVVTIKTADGTERTIKYTDHTAIKAGKKTAQVPADTWLGTKEGSRVIVRYTETAGEKTAVAVKDAGKATAKAAR
ncbi:hypothetical protein [Terriglobus tenax]|uniref:hypothetical protein n=1 Tax=Terriglobus tenax TaxID=1111115 RepID=UPI0021E0344B|nr:hypothetical protein [Terriglobus tenax]